MTVNKNRIEWVDIAKGIGIFLVCLAHRDIPRWLGKWIYSFHLPLFFFLAGYTTDFKRYNGIKGFLTKKAKGLIIPYFSLGILFIVWEFLYTIIYKGERFALSNYVWRLLFSGLGSSWFVLAIFFTEVFAYVINLMPEKGRILITSVIFLAGIVLNNFLKNQLVWNINTAFVGILFFEISQMSYARNLFDRFIKSKSILTHGIIIFLSIVSTLINSKVDMLYRQYGDSFLFLIGAFSGICIVIKISTMIEKTDLFRKIFSFLGKNTLPIIEFHYHQGYIITETFFYRVFGLKYMNNIFSWNIEGFIHVISVLLLLWPVIELLNRFLPFAVGKNKKSIISK